MPALSRIRSAAALSLLLALPAAAVSAAEPPARDRQSILAMQGEYLVDFAFDETVLLKPGYERAPAMRSGGDEVVIVVEDTPGRIVLQHLLLEPKSGHVTKHWRQDWTWEAARRFEFSADQTWSVRAVPAALTRGAWTQCVYEFSDAPRYCGTGRWNYDNGVATWTSDLSWRPLPRREYTRRSDYNALAVINRHTLTPAAGPTSSSTPRSCAAPTAACGKSRANSASTTTAAIPAWTSRRPVATGRRPRGTGRGCGRAGSVSWTSRRACA